MPAPACTMLVAVLDHDRADRDRRCPCCRSSRSSRRRRRTAPRRTGSSSSMISIARTFGAPDSVPAGKHGAQHVEARRAPRAAPRDVRDDVHHVRVALDDRRRLDTRTQPVSRTRPTSLRPRSTSITCSARSFGSASRSSAIASSSSGVAPRGRVPAIGRVETWRPETRRGALGRRADERALEVEEEHVRGRVDHAQLAVDRERLDLQLRAEALREHDLEDVAGVDVLDDPRDPLLERLARQVGLERRLGPGRGGRRAGAARGAAAHLADRLAGALARVVVLVDVGVREDRHGVHVVVRDDPSDSSSATSGRPTTSGLASGTRST